MIFDEKVFIIIQLYFESRVSGHSELEVTWTNQHGFGYDVRNEHGPLKVQHRASVHVSGQQGK